MSTAVTMKVVARRTGLSPHVLRVWERRYEAVKPSRTDTNRRLYSEQEVQRLILLKRASDLGHGIGRIARLSQRELSSLLEENAGVEAVETNGVVPETVAMSTPGGVFRSGAAIVESALEATGALDAQELGGILNRSAVELGHGATLERVVVPFVEEVGERWAVGTFRVSHEHLATSVLRTFLGSFSSSFAPERTSPTLVVTTPAGQLHELGALIIAAAARTRGWRVVYLGPSLPAEEIVGAVLQAKARAVALSLVYPEDDGELPSELVRLGKLLPGGMSLLAGGRATRSYRAALVQSGATVLSSLGEFYVALERLRVGREESRLETL